MKKLQKGFTLIELMIVIAIIAILAAILIPNFLHARAEAQISATEGNLKQIATAEEEYAVDHNGTYAPDANIQVAPYLPSKYPNSPSSAGGAYGVTIPGPGTTGAYQITDSGTYDKTAMPQSLQTDAAATCFNVCTTVHYNQAGGVHGT